MRSIRYFFGCFFLCLLVGCGLKKFAEGVQADAAYLLEIKKEFFHQLGFSGIVEEKTYCNECKTNKFKLSIKLNEAISDLAPEKKQYYDFYEFKSDSVLQIAVSKSIYDLTNKNCEIIKNPNESEVIICNRILTYLSRDKGKWY